MATRPFGIKAGRPAGPSFDVDGGGVCAPVAVTVAAAGSVAANAAATLRAAVTSRARNLGVGKETSVDRRGHRLDPSLAHPGGSRRPWAQKTSGFTRLAPAWVVGAARFDDHAA